MPLSHANTRHWSGPRLLLAWLASLVALGTLRWMLEAGAYRATIQEQEVLRVGGYWPPEFATFMSVVAAMAALVVLIWSTISWVKARKERRALRAAASAGHRRVLM